MVGANPEYRAGFRSEPFLILNLYNTGIFPFFWILMIKFPLTGLFCVPIPVSIKVPPDLKLRRGSVIIITFPGVQVELGFDISEICGSDDFGPGWYIFR